MKIITLAALLLVTATSCRSSLPSGERFGEPLETRAIVAFATVDASPTEYFDQTLLVEAEVTAVCEKKGCWMQVADEGKTAMVRWESGCEGQYTFPMDAIGKRVLIQGSFYPKTISEEDAEHLESEGAGEVDREGYEFNASAVLIME